MVMVSSMHISSSKYKSPILASIAWFGVIEEIWELYCYEFKVPIFKCKWVNSSNGLHSNELCFGMVDLDKVDYKDEPCNKDD